MSQIDDGEQTVVSQPSTPVLGMRFCPKCRLVVAESTNVCPQDGTQIFEATEQVLSSKYEFISVAGSGGMSVVYKARQQNTGEIVAIKMLHSLLMNEHSLKRFQQEAKAITSLRHPNIINVHDFGVSEHGQPYMVMDFIDGSTLASVIKEKGGLSLDESLHRFIQLCDALEHAHECGILHRDLKPSNIMISNRDGNFEDARIVDFGIAKLMDKEGASKDDGHLTQTGELFGSPLYMSPEQCRGQIVDARTDIYSMGCVMYETLTGRPPLKGGSMIETIVLQMTEKPLSLSEACPQKQFPEQLENVIAKALEKDPDHRYQNMTELEFALMQIRPNQEPGKKVRPRKEKSSYIEKKLLKPLALSFAAGAALGAGAVALWQHSDTKSNQLKPTIPITQSSNSDSDRLIDTADRIGKIKSNIQEQDLVEAMQHGDLGITKVDLSQSKIHDGSATMLASMKSATKINLDEDPITNATLAALSTLPRLQELSLRRTLITDEGLRNLIPVGKTLKTLYLTATKIDNYGIITIAREFPKLTALSVTELKFDNEHFAKLGSLPLETLYADQTSVDDSGVQALAKMTTLKDLQLNFTRTGNSGLSALKDLRNLTRLGLANTLITPEAMATVANFKKLKELDIGGTRMKNSGIKPLSQLTNLKKLGLYRTNITDGALAYLIHLPLTSLNLADDDITDAGLDNVLQLQQLEALDIGGTKVSDAGIMRLSKLDKLTSLNLIGCTNISLKGARTLHEKRPKLKITLLDGRGDNDIDWLDPRNFLYYPPN